MRIFERNQIVLGGLLLLTLLMRAFSFHYSVIDHDESTYLVIAQELLRGRAYYTDVWDTKPIGIFWVFGLLIKTFGHEIWAVRLGAVLSIAFSSFFLFSALIKLNFSRSAALLAAVSFVLMSSMHKWTFSANSELFFLFFTTLTFYLLSVFRRSWIAILAGLCIGFGFLIKYVVLFDFLALSGFLILCNWGNWRKALIQLVLFGVGFALPFAVLWTWYFHFGPYEEFVFATFELPGRYVSEAGLAKSLSFTLGYYGSYLPFTVLFVAGLLFGKNRKIMLLAGMWSILVWIVVLVPGKHFLHYYFQLVLPTSLGIAGFIGSENRLHWWLEIRWKVVVGLLFAGLVGWNLYMQFRYFIARPDHRREVAGFLKPRLKPSDRIYCNASNALYFLLNRSPLERYIHPTLLTNPDHIQAVGLNPEKEFNTIIEARPEYLVLEGDQVPGIIKRYADEQCTLLKSIGTEFHLYQRNSEGSNPVLE